MRNQSSRLPIILTIILLLALCCLCISLVIFASGSIILARSTTPTVDPPTIIEQPLADLVQPTRIVTPTDQGISTPGTDIGEKIDTLEVLKAANVPINDPILLAEQLGGKTNIPRTFPDPNAPYQVGDSKAFWVTNVDTRQNFQVIATLRYLGEHTYFWIEDNVAYEPEDLVQLGDTFDQEIVPMTRAFFGSEWSPGVDHDPRIHILYARNLGEFLAGYYSSSDELHPDAHQFSNAHEMFLINADTMRLWHDSIYSTLAHELQHMIHWHIDKNEETWLNEGFSMLAELINGYDPGGFDRQYIQNTDLQLTDWGSSIGSNGPHYGAAMLFTTYFYDRFGATVTQKLVAEQKNGLEGIDAVLQELDIRDPLTGEPLTAEDVFADWAVANLLGDPNIGDGRYYYNIYPQAPQAAPTTHLTACPTGPFTYHVAQFGVDAIKISCPGDLTLSFAGETTTNLLPIEPYSGSFFFWSNTGDQSNMSLKREFDLTEVSGPVNMTYQTWYDLELDYDYVFVSASIDGISWQILNSTSCTMNNPSGNSYGCGLTGASDGWQLEQVDLTPFAGKLVSLRFDYITDAAVNGNGFALDDIRIDAINYFTDFEADDGGWLGEGFVRIQNVLPQSFRVTMITYGKRIHVVPLELDENNQFEIDISLGQDIESIILVISGTTPYTRQRAVYQVEVEPLP
ncbi:MAG TPA: immune inhibitor A [Brevefilum fermentans]|jgi:hypothetical protein|uniref:Uncharacterized protein n=1 Tax=Candidatus Brevifilum fermentans TaxID=1986204 RepID=A0A1Y6K5R9_9CHLR|nr:immune inhibitor A domain-containing protein [Brevefilum fermentans]MDI9565228.1 immune inhibitor A [Chloroflexota bacterium]OQB82780.1 MAG: Neutral metalloprotease precursor [Chloroflexi bacterium ADurb.Bin120]SMX54983.1 conserved exported protein of unknown function [Brevefilum fermentans]HPX94859.1 immune inhibitor A [Brevefilum fermentans]HQA28554.1 immune inhibitor A [Brevefilum fermentans]